MEKILHVILLNVLLMLACQNDAQRSVSAPLAAALSRDSGAGTDSLAPSPSKRKAEPKPAANHDQSTPQKSGARIPHSPAKGNNPDTPPQNGFVELTTLDRSLRLDIRYATTDNFTKSKIYDCPRCLLRPEAAAAIVEAHKVLQKKGLGLKMFDCYRPRPYQQRLWNKVPNPDYVTPPAKGSMHSRGAAVDLTIVDAQGQELDMGTPYDFFGVAAHTDCTDLPAKVLANRRLLRETLEAVGFKGIRTEWWHFSYQSKSYPLSDYVWPCGQ
ncbi:MAG: D-alanyl-D-alanine dipeptidase [Saprospiraceae bacterium]